MGILLCILYYEILPLVFLIKKKSLIWAKILAFVVYNIILIKVIAPPSIYRLEELGLSSTAISIFYYVCEVVKYIAPFIFAVLFNLPIIFRRVRDRIKRVD
jgi:hypothetical protein